MHVGAVVELVREVDQARTSGSAGRKELTAALGAMERVMAWLHARQAELVSRLAQCTSFPEADLAGVTRTNVREADRVLKRAVVLEQAPVFAEALDDATVTAGHVDVLERTLRGLDPAQREGLLERAEELAEVAGRATVDEFARRMRTEVRRLCADDGLSRLERQRRDARLRTWVDQGTGMWHLAGRFDPETGVALSGRLDIAVDALFAESTPSTCPSDPFEKQDHLRALALVALTGVGAGDPGSEPGSAGAAGAETGPGGVVGRGMRWGRPEFTVVVDTTATDPSTGGPVVDWGLPVELPMQVLRDLWQVADVHAVVVHDGMVLHAPGNLNLGDTARVANRAQRRALRALYKTCAIPDCEVPYRRCKLHHVIWWEQRQRTDLEDLLPVCDGHHHAIHDHGWQVALGPRRELTVDLPDGTRYTTGPPRRGREPVTKTLRASAASSPERCASGSSPPDIATSGISTSDGSAIDGARSGRSATADAATGISATGDSASDGSAGHGPAPPARSAA